MLIFIFQTIEGLSCASVNYYASAPYVAAVLTNVLLILNFIILLMSFFLVDRSKHRCPVPGFYPLSYTLAHIISTLYQSSQISKTGESSKCISPIDKFCGLLLTCDVDTII